MNLRTAFNVEIPQGAAPEWLQLLPRGPRIVGRDGRNWLFDDQAMASVLTEFQARGISLPLDINHSTELRAPQGLDSPAAGWIVELQDRSGEVWGRVEWTPSGAEQVANRAYRFVSPVFAFEKESGRVLALLNAALTNTPNLRLQALNSMEDQQMDPKILAALGLAAGATDEQVLAAINSIKQSATAANAERVPGSVATALGLAAGATPEQAVVAANAMRSERLDVTKYVPRADLDQALARAVNAENALKSKDEEAVKAAINSTVDQAVKDGKIAPASKEFYIATCSQEGGLERFKAFLESAPVIAGGQGKDGAPEGQNKALNAEEQKIASMFGNSAEDLAKYGKE